MERTVHVLRALTGRNYSAILGRRNAVMLSTGSATQIAFLIIAVIQAMCGIIWALGAYLLGTARGAVVHWVGWSMLSSVTWFILAARLDSPPLVGILVGILGVMCLQRGIRLFIARPPTYGLQAGLLLAVVVAYLLALYFPLRPLQATVNFGVLAWLYFGTARDLYTYARHQLRLRWPWLLCVPLLLGGGAYGSRAVRALVEPDSVLTEMTTNSALNLGSALAFVVLVLALHATLMALVVTRLTSELRRMSRHDSLTGLLNRRAMEELLFAQVQRSVRGRESFAVMMLDLDHFKRVNDHYGHAVGDQALKHVAQLLRGSVREVDSLARFGGEEFVVLMPGASLAQAQPIAERLRERLYATPLVCAETTVPLSISIGIAQWRGGGEDLSQLLVRADTALFQAKGQGRNRVVSDLGERAA
jgi:diguanylate cyclase (GGDEF)-like protein